MRKWLLILVFIISSPLAMAETLTPDMIKQVHEQVKASFFDGCSKDLKGTVVEICRCLAEKTQTNLDDTALSKCNNDNSGQNCVVKIVKDASTKATTPDSITDCKKKVESSEATTSMPATDTKNVTTTPNNTTTVSTPNNAPATTTH